MRPTLITEINSFANSISSLSSWMPFDQPFGHLDGTEDDYVYEFWCSIRVLKDLSVNYKAIKISGPNAKKLFPIKPGLLENGGYAFFEIAKDLLQSIEFQICLGIEITNSADKNDTVAPDISFLKPIGRKNPTENDVLLVFDSKYKVRKYKKGVLKKVKFTKSQIREFAKIVDDLNLRGKSNSFQFDQLTELNTNCLLSNIDVIKKHANYCSKNQIRQIGKFISGETYEVLG